MSGSRTWKTWSLLGSAALVVGMVGAPAGIASASSGAHKVLVSRSGWCDGKAALTTISAGVAAVNPGGTVQVCRGTYDEDVVVTKPVTLHGLHALVDPGADTSSPLYSLIGNNAFTVLSPHVTIRGFTAQGATGDGIFLAGDRGLVENVLARNNAVNGINVDGSSYSTIRGNTVTGNTGGIELANDPHAAGITLPGVTGTATHDLVIGNTVVKNPGACGIYLVDHAGTTDGTLNMTFGIHDNVIRNNKVVNNATSGYGGGVLLATEVPGGAVYHNLVAGNTIAGNQLSGVFLHSHLPNQYLNGNVIINNNIGKNNLTAFLEPDDPETTGIFIGTQDPLKITIVGNKIHDDHYGIFTAGPVTVTSVKLNSFKNVTVHFGSVPVFTG